MSERDKFLKALRPGDEVEIPWGLTTLPAKVLIVSESRKHVVVEFPIFGIDREVLMTDTVSLPMTQIQQLEPA